jgi:hypothetical protein
MLPAEGLEVWGWLGGMKIRRLLGPLFLTLNSLS